MSAAVMYPYESHWQIAAKDEHRFDKVLIIVIVLFTLCGLLVPFIPVPEIERSKAESIPPRLAKLIVEKKKIEVPKPIPKEEKAEEKPEEKPEKKKEEKPKKKDKEAARKKAASSGLLALKDQFADLRQNSALNSLKNKKALSRKGTNKSVSTRSLITATASSNSGGINTSRLTRTVSGTNLASRSTTAIEQPIEIQEMEKQAHKRGLTRSIEEIQLVFDQNKGAIYSIYNRELRKNPTLKGKVVLSITIDPSGTVIECKIISNEVDSKSFGRKLVARVKLFDFGEKDADTIIITYPIEFLPS